MERAIKSAVDYVDEIIVIHDGPCVDRSLEIASKYGCIVRESTRQGNCEAHLIEGLNAAKNDWILKLDGDEYLSKELAESLYSLTSRPSADIYEFSIPTRENGKKYTFLYFPRLYRKSKIKYINVIHQYTDPIDRSATIKRRDFVIEHDPKYDNFEIKRFIKKQTPWAKSHAQKLLSDTASLEMYNTNTFDWPLRTRLRIMFPLILGMLGSFLYHITVGIKNTVKYKDFYFLKHSFFTGIYFVMVFFIVFIRKLKRLLWGTYE